MDSVVVLDTAVVKCYLPIRREGRLILKSARWLVGCEEVLWDFPALQQGWNLDIFYWCAMVLYTVQLQLHIRLTYASLLLGRGSRTAFHVSTKPGHMTGFDFQY